jgi:hypothetical protein
MKKLIGVAVAVALVGGVASQSMAANCDSGEMIRFTQHCFAYETNYNSATHVSAAGSVLSIVGHVSYFCFPMASLDPSDPAKEYTFYITGLVSAGTASFGPFRSTDYSGGTWEIHEGSPEDAPLDGGMPALPSPLVPATFTDGPVVLSGTFANFHVDVDATASIQNGSFRADYTATGGLYYPMVGNTPDLFTGVWCVKPASAGGCVPATYSAHPDGKWDQTPSTPTLPSTWGKIKQLYR